MYADGSLDHQWESDGGLKNSEEQPATSPETALEQPEEQGEKDDYPAPEATRVAPAENNAGSIADPRSGFTSDVPDTSTLGAANPGVNEIGESGSGGNGAAKQSSPQRKSGRQGAGKKVP